MVAFVRSLIRTWIDLLADKHGVPIYEVVDVTLEPD